METGSPAPHVTIMPARGRKITLVVSFPYKPMDSFILWQWSRKTNDWRLVKQSAIKNPFVPIYKYRLHGVPPPPAQSQADLKIVAVYASGARSVATLVRLPRPNV